MTIDDDFIEKYPQGYWKVEDKKFISKYEALLYGSTIKKPVKYIFFDSVWENFDRSKIGKHSLNYLYKQRALQLRNTYDYLILYFSGGADSYNVLRSFIDNDIPLDEVCVKWAVDIFKSNTTIYTPNTQNITATNYLSEWDFAIKPVLEMLSIQYPKIKITILDWFENKKIIESEDLYKKVNHWHDIEIPSLAIWSPSEKYHIEKGKKVGSIYGIDKPSTYHEKNKSYMQFADSATGMGTPNDINPFGTEYFYYAPTFPELTFEMASVVSKSPFIRAQSYDSLSTINTFFNRQRYLIKLLYTTWEGRFQVHKPIRPNREDKHFWIYQNSELSLYKNTYNEMKDQHLKKIKNLVISTNHRFSNYDPIKTKKHLL